MVSSFQEIYTFDCGETGGIAKESTNKNKVNPEGYYDLTQLTIRELEAIEFQEDRQTLLKAAWLKKVEQKSQDDLCTITLPWKWIEGLSDETSRKLYFKLFSELLEELWLNILKRDGSSLIYFQKKNKFSDDSFTAFMKALIYFEEEELAHGNDIKTHLVLESHSLGNAKMRRLGKYLEQTQALSLLDLTNNEIDHIGAIILAQYLEANESLKVIHLSGNPLGNEGLLTLAETFAEHPLIREIHMKHISCHPDVHTALNALIQKNPRIEKWVD